MKKRRPQIPPDELHFRAHVAEMVEMKHLAGQPPEAFPAAFLKAARFGWNWSLDRLLKMPTAQTGGRLLSIETADDDGRTALLLAANEGYYKTVEFLLHKGADINRQDARRKTALHLATRNSWGAAVDMLLESGADPDLADYKGETPLHAAARTGHLAITQRLIAAGANPLLRDHKGRTALDLAFERHEPALETALFSYTQERTELEKQRRESAARNKHAERLIKIDRLSRRRRPPGPA